MLKANNVQNILGIPSIDTGILGAVIAGIIVWMLHERFHTIRLPDALAFSAVRVLYLSFPPL